MGGVCESYSVFFFSLRAVASTWGRMSFGSSMLRRGGSFCLTFRSGGAGPGGIEDAGVGGQGGEGSPVRAGVEDAGELPGESVFEVERTEAKQLVDGAGDTTHAAVGVCDGARNDPWADDREDAAMGVDVVDTALSVVPR